ncbi:hypothetical protein QVA66_10180 [Staphylococcus chromogenes]|nr:hypothetical protein [Staphylococcus chromogenes]
MSMHWEASDEWWDNHNDDQLYRIVLSAPGLTEARWAEMAADSLVEDGCILFGGAYLKRVGAQEVEAVSGGQDAFDSLEYAINDVLLGACPKARVLREEKLSDPA